MKERTKNIILYVVICLLTIIVVFISLRIYNNRIEEINNKSIVSSYLSEIKYEDISSNVQEEPNTIIYVSNSGDESSKNFERKFVNVIKKYNLENNIIYINIYNSNIIDQVYSHAPELVIYENDEINEIIDMSTLSNEKEIIRALKERRIIND